ncbi:hypothetical protein ABNF65_19460, partial [Paenibacillus larvae]
KTYNFVDIQRSYRLYAALADVRNYNRVKPISEPRGLPSDVSAVVKEQSDEWGAYAHHRSYLTVKELSEFDWNQKIRFEALWMKNSIMNLRKMALQSGGTVKRMIWIPKLYTVGYSGRKILVTAWAPFLLGLSLS